MKGPNLDYKKKNVHISARFSGSMVIVVIVVVVVVVDEEVVEVVVEIVVVVVVEEVIVMGDGWGDGGMKRLAYGHMRGTITRLRAKALPRV